jgi:hypothetical protein
MCRRRTHCSSDQLGYASSSMPQVTTQGPRGSNTNSRPWINMRTQACASRSIAGSHPCGRRLLVSGVTATSVHGSSPTGYREPMLRLALLSTPVLLILIRSYQTEKAKFCFERPRNLKGTSCCAWRNFKSTSYSFKSTGGRRLGEDCPVVRS